MGPINNILELFQIMAWRRPGDKPLSEPMMFSLPTHICVIRSQLITQTQTWQTDRGLPGRRCRVPAQRWSNQKCNTLQWRHNERDGVSNHQPHDCLLDQKTHQSSASLAFVREIHRWPTNSPDKEPVTRKMIPFDDVIMCRYTCSALMRQRQVLLWKYLEYAGDQTTLFWTNPIPLTNIAIGPMPRRGLRQMHLLMSLFWTFRRSKQTWTFRINLSEF